MNTCLWCEGDDTCTELCWCMECTGKPTVWDLADEAYEHHKEDGF